MPENVSVIDTQEEKKIEFEEFKKEIIDDYRLACISREASLIGRKEVLTGKAKFGIFGDGKEIPQIAMAKTFLPGDFRSGYYRDQTFAFATGMANVEEFFSQLFADTDIENEPHSAGRQMNAHFSSRNLDNEGKWKELTKTKNSASDTSPTASQMARAVGLALASKVFRENPEADPDGKFSDGGNEVTFCTIGDASTSEGIFWEAINAAGVMRIPLAVSVWDDGYGISVPKKYQTTKESISEALSGLEVNEKGQGFDIYRVKGWDYAGLIETYKKGIQKVRETHIPAIFHIEEVTQPQGHSTSGSHERYKSTERLEWEKEYDCIAQMGAWMVKHNIATEEEVEGIRKEAKKTVSDAKKVTWKKYLEPIQVSRAEVTGLMENVAAEIQDNNKVNEAIQTFQSQLDPIRRDIIAAAMKVLRLTINQSGTERKKLSEWVKNFEKKWRDSFRSHLYSESDQSISNIDGVPAGFSENAEMLNGFEIINRFFEATFENRPELIAFGEDLGKIGDVNQGFAGLQEKFGEKRIFDTGIREATIVGQGIGMAMRGLRPVAEIQYLDYLIYGLQPLVDDLATLQYRTKGGQKAPVIIRTRGHRLEGIWHTGSPLAMIINSLKGINICVPRNMTQAAGMYNTLLKSDEPGLVIECLNGYRLKEKLPDNLAEYTVAFGIPETVKSGEDVTLVSYGSTLRIVEQAAVLLEECKISAEIIDVQTLIPFDIHHRIVESLEKTGRIVFIDEDVPGGTTAFLMQQVLEIQGGYYFLDSKPLTITASENRSAYASDGDYFCKPNIDEIFEKIYTLMHETDPTAYPEF